MDRGAWQATVHGVTKSWIQLSDFHALGILGLVSPLFNFVQFSSVQSLSRVQLFVIPWTAACKASLSITNPTPTFVQGIFISQYQN